MLILSHRGFWTHPDEKNALGAFDRTVASGFGTETDVRDCGGELVIAHDPPMADALLLTEVLDRFDGKDLPLALNIKADGLATQLAKAMTGRTIPWFAFDMSAPETIRFARLGLPFFTRHSDYEPSPLLYAKAQGVWLDAFDSEWYDREVVMRHLDAGKQLCIVSSDLHGRPVQPLWARLRQWGIAGQAGAMLCTDIPEDARTFFEMD